MSTMLPVLTEFEKAHISERQPLPERYLGLSDEELDRRITAAKATLGSRLIILGHHYQRDEVIKFADYIGDSFRLSGEVAKHPEAEFIVFCGVHFMAESADVLSAPHQKVILPDLAAGCSMADMAAIDQLETCWDELSSIVHRPSSIVDERRSPIDERRSPIDERRSPIDDGRSPIDDGRSPIIPITYINSSAAIKAFVGERGGIVCTSTNCAATLRWAWERGERVLFLPDQHLGRNTAYKMGVALDQMVVWDPHEMYGGQSAEQLLAAKMILWKGHCSVHERFTVAQIERIRQQHPGVRVIVHPEVPWDVVQAADDSGSTEYIIRQVTNGAPGSIWAVGTEIHLVNRLAKSVAPEKTVLSLDQFGCLCSTMFRVSPNHLLWILEGLIEGRIHNRIIVSDEQKHWTKVALDRMLSVH